MNLTETGETRSFTDPVHVIKHVEAFAFTCSSDFVYVQKRRSLFSGALSSDWCDSVMYLRIQPFVSRTYSTSWFVFSAGSEESIVLLSDFPVSSSLGEYLKIPQLSSNGSPSGVTFTSEGNILYLFSPILMLCDLIRNGDGSFATNCAPLKFGRKVAPLSCVENCALSRQGNSIAISPKSKHISI